MNKEWGPPLWRVLHVLGERHTMAVHNGGVLAFLDNLATTLPCRMCQKHYRDFLLAYPLKPRIDQRPPARGAPPPAPPTWDPRALRTWLWRLHCAVTARNKVPDVSGAVVTDAECEACFPVTALTPLYGTMSVASDIEFLYTYLNRQSLMTQVPAGKSLMLFRQQLERLRTIYKL